MSQSKEPYFLESKNVLLSIAIAFFLTNCIEFLILFAGSLLLAQPMHIDILQYFLQSLLIVSGLWASFKILKRAPIYLIAFSVSSMYTLVMIAWFVIISTPFIKEHAMTDFISSFLLIFIWMHLTQNLENKSKALKTGYFSYFICIELMSLLHGYINGKNNIAFLILAILGYKISSIIFDLMVKVGFKLFRVKID